MGSAGCLHSVTVDESCRLRWIVKTLTCLVLLIGVIYDLVNSSRGIHEEHTLCLLLGLLTAVMLHSSFQVYSESILVVPDSGIQLQRQYFTGSKTCQLYPWENIFSIAINEVISMQAIYFSMVLLLRPESGDVSQLPEEPSDIELRRKQHMARIPTIVPIFQSFTPRLATLQVIYRDITTKFHDKLEL
eukprot:m.173880 g.173880  ORF g.173880 m.173880 type:complete len:188 (-) comp15397_c0_seq1:1247-1810(-)